MSKEIDLRIELKLWGTIFSVQLEIEANEIKPLYYDAEKDLFFKEFEDFEVDDTLDVFLRCKGRQGAKATLSVLSEKAKLDKKMHCKIARGACTNEKFFELS